MNPFDLESEKFRILFGEQIQLLDRVDATVQEVGKISIVMSGTPGQRGLLGDLEEVRDSISEASKALEPIVGAALPQKIDSLTKQFEQIPQKVWKAADSLDFRTKIGEVMLEAAKPTFEQARECAAYSFSAHIHAEAGKAVSAAVTEHLADAIETNAYIGNLEGKVDALQKRVAAHEETIESQKGVIRALSSGKVNRVLLWFTFALGWGAAVFAAEFWSVITAWLVQQPIPAWFLPRSF